MCEKRAVNDETVVAFDVSRIAFVVVDAVAVEGERGVAEQECAVEMHGFGVVLARWGHGWRWLCLRLVFAVNEVLVFGQGKGHALLDVVAHAHKSQRTRTARFAGNAFDHRGFFSADACEKRAMPDEFSGGPHPTRQTEIGNKAALGGMPVAAQGVGRLRIPKVDVMRKRWQGIANLNWCHVAKGGGQGLRAPDIHRVG